MSTPPPPADVPADQLFADCYRELRRLAHARLRDSGPRRPLDTTALVHETYLRLSGGAVAAFPDRARFLVYAGQAMRSIIIDFVRERGRQRRGGDAPHVTLTEGLAGVPAAEAEILAVHEALEQLARVDERMARVVEMRYFGGLTDTEIGEALGVTDRTVRRDWEEARLFLARALR